MSGAGWMGIGTAGAMAGSNLIGTAAQYGFNKKLMKQQQDYARDMYKSRFQYTVADMRAAGLNPVLAAGGPHAGSPSATGIAGVSAPGIANPALTAQQFKRNREEIANVTRTGANIQKTGRILDEQRQLTRDQQQETRARALQHGAAAYANEQMAQRTIAETTHLLLGIPSAQIAADLYSGKGGKILRTLREVFGSLPPVMIGPIPGRPGRGRRGGDTSKQRERHPLLPNLQKGPWIP